MPIDILLANLFLEQHANENIYDVFGDILGNYRNQFYSYTKDNFSEWHVIVDSSLDYSVWLEAGSLGCFAVDNKLIKRITEKYDDEGLSILQYINFEDLILAILILIVCYSNCSWFIMQKRLLMISVSWVVMMQYVQMEKLKDLNFCYSYDSVEIQSFNHLRLICEFDLETLEFGMFDPMSKVNINILDHIPKEDLI